MSGKKSYYVGYSDLRQEGIGYHIPNEMNGLWFPPLRILKWISITASGRVTKPKTVSVNVSSRTFSYQKFSIELVSSNTLDFALIFRPEIEKIDPVKIILEIGIIPVWFSDKTVKYDMKLNKRENTVEINEEVYGMRVSIYSYPEREVSLVGNTVSFIADSQLSVLISASNRLSESLEVNKIHDIHFSSYRSFLLESLNSQTSAEGNNPISTTFELAKMNLNWLTLETDGIGTGVVAGYPEFPWFFGIDTYYCSRGLLISGMINEYESTLGILEKYAKTQAGRIPHEIVTNGRIFNRGNLVESIVYPTMVWNLYEYSGITNIIESRKDLLRHSVKYVFNAPLNGTGIMEDPGAGTGIDIDTICNYIETMRVLLKISKITELDIIEEKSIEREIEEKLSFLRKEMWISEVNGFSDRIVDGVPQFNGFWTTILPFSYALASGSQYRKFSSESSEAYGKLIHKEGLKVDSNGRIMFNGNSMMIKACLNYGDINRGMKFFKSNVKSVGRYSNGCFPEVINDSTGCFIQAWSASLFIENLIYDILGIVPRNNSLSQTKKFKIPALFNGLIISRMKYRGKNYRITVSNGSATLTKQI